VDVWNRLQFQFISWASRKGNRFRQDDKDLMKGELRTEARLMEPARRPPVERGSTFLSAQEKGTHGAHHVRTSPHFEGGPRILRFGGLGSWSFVFGLGRSTDPDVSW
jgi:hypothetical protein